MKPATKLQTTPMKLPQLFYKIATKVVRKSRLIVGASSVGVKALVVNQQQEILLIEHTYTDGWYLPGGGVQKGETLEAAVIRELKEETGVVATNTPDLFGIYHHIISGLDDYPALYIIKDFTIGKSFSHEIKSVKWFSYENLPENTSRATIDRINEYFYKATRSQSW